MMTEAKMRSDGGPAFPTYYNKTETHSDRLDGMPDYTARSFGSFGGMTLRDWFAGQALVGICGHPDNLGLDTGDVARCAYELADAMLQVRGEK